MSRPRHRIASFLTGAIFIFVSPLILGLPTPARAQQSPAATLNDTERGIKLYQQGDTLGAIEALRTAVKYRKDDPDAWLYLGIALSQMSRIKDARKAFETAVKLNPNSAAAHAGWAYTLVLANKLREATREAERALSLDPQNAEAHYLLGVVRMKEREPSNALKEAEATLKIKPNFAPALLLKTQALIGIYAERLFFVGPSPLSTKATTEDFITRIAPLREAAESLEKYLQLTPKAMDAELWREQLEALRPYVEAASKPEAERTIWRVKEVTTKARILNKPEPGFTEEARLNQISGTVVLSAVLGDEGTVRNILVLSELPYGLTREAIKAARKIKFAPATKNGRPVSQFVQIEYNFNLY